MIAKKPPMGWNSWNTFGEHISEQLIFEMCDVMVKEGYRDAGYEYLVIDDCWALRERSADGKLVPDPAKFPHGMKAVSDYVHNAGLKFGMYSCAGVRTCAGYPSSYDHEYVDARTFAEWGVDFLKYDFCNFPSSGDCKARYLTMSMALKASGRDILFSACNWGVQEPWHWMRSIGAHMYRSTGDIFDNFKSFTTIAMSQLPNFCDSASGCYNDIDMLTVGMYGKGNVGMGKPCTDGEYRVQFGMWCMLSAPLMMGADLRALTPAAKELMQNKELLALDQDEEGRPPYVISKPGVFQMTETVGENGQPFEMIPDQGVVMMKHLSDNRFAFGFFNYHEKEASMQMIFADAGIPYNTGVGMKLHDIMSGEDFGTVRDYVNVKVPGRDMRILIGEMTEV